MRYIYAVLLFAVTTPGILYAGPSPWVYFAPYQDNPSTALKLLKEKEFKSGSYLGPGGTTYDSKKDTRAKPKSIKALINIQAENGTHSIIDISHINQHFLKKKEHEYYGGLFLVKASLVYKIFGTDKPTHKMFVSKQKKLLNLIERGYGFYFIVYKNNKPHEYYFIGMTGD